MTKNGLKATTGSRATLAMGWVLASVVCVALLIGFALFTILPDKLAESYFKPTTGFLINKQMSVKNHLVPRYRADFLVSYNVGHVQYNRWVSANGLNRSFHFNQSRQERLLDKFAIGHSYPVYVNPKNPEEALLLFRYNWTAIFIVSLLILIGMLTFSYNLKKLR